MRSRAVFIVTLLSLGLSGPVLGQDNKKKRKWDQKEALERVKEVLAQEAKEDFAWDNISWGTDVDKAVARSQKEQKPIFLYFFLKGKVGPAKAPC